MDSLWTSTKLPRKASWLSSFVCSGCRQVDEWISDGSTMGYLILLGGVWLAAMLGLKVGELAGRLTDSTIVAGT